MKPSSIDLIGDPALLSRLETMDDAGLDALEIGVIGFAADTRVTRYNAYESSAAGLAREQVIGHPLFTDIAQCMNNFMVAQRFVNAQSSGLALDETIDFTLTWRMDPTPVKMRLLSAPAVANRYLVLHRLGPAHPR